MATEYKFTPKYDIGERVWYIRRGVVSEVKVAGIIRNIFPGEGDPIFTLYDVEDANGEWIRDVEEYDLCPTRQDGEEAIRERKKALKEPGNRWEKVLETDKSLKKLIEKNPRLPVLYVEKQGYYYHEQFNHHEGFGRRSLWLVAAHIDEAVEMSGEIFLKSDKTIDMHLYSRARAYENIPEDEIDAVLADAIERLEWKKVIVAEMGVVAYD